MERVSPGERATLAAGMTLLWNLGWVIAPIYYGLLQARLGFYAGYAVDFVTIIVLYTIATSLLWHWFRDTDTTTDTGEVVAPIPVEAPTLLEHA
jgi:MFS family permease